MTGYVPINDDDAITLTASATIIGGQVLQVSGVNTVAPAGAGATVVGVAAFDAVSGAKVTIFDPDMEHETTSTAGVTAGDLLKAGAGGTVETDGAPTVAATFGVAITTAAAGAKARWKGL